MSGIAGKYFYPALYGNRLSENDLKKGKQIMSKPLYQMNVGTADTQASARQNHAHKANRVAAKNHNSIKAQQDLLKGNTATIEELADKDNLTVEQCVELNDAITSSRKPAARELTSKLAHAVNKYVKDADMSAEYLEVINEIKTKAMDEQEVTAEDIKVLNELRVTIADAIKKEDPKQPMAGYLKEASNLHVSVEALDQMSEATLLEKDASDMTIEEHKIKVAVIDQEFAKVKEQYKDLKVAVKMPEHVKAMREVHANAIAKHEREVAALQQDLEDNTLADANITGIDFPEGGMDLSGFANLNLEAETQVQEPVELTAEEQAMNNELHGYTDSNVAPSANPTHVDNAKFEKSVEAAQTAEVEPVISKGPSFAEMQAKAAKDHNFRGLHARDDNKQPAQQEPVAAPEVTSEEPQEKKGLFAKIKPAYNKAEQYFENIKAERAIKAMAERQLAEGKNVNEVASAMNEGRQPNIAQEQAVETPAQENIEHRFAKGGSELEAHFADMDVAEAEVSVQEPTPAEPKRNFFGRMKDKVVQMKNNVVQMKNNVQTKVGSLFASSTVEKEAASGLDVQPQREEPGYSADGLDFEAINAALEANSVDDDFDHNYADIEQIARDLHMNQDATPAIKDVVKDTKLEAANEQDLEQEDEIGLAAGFYK